MKSLHALKCRATESIRWRGHTMSRWETFKNGRAISHCLFCKAEVYLVQKPHPNEVEISGEAVSGNCTGVHTK